MLELSNFGCLCLPWALSRLYHSDLCPIVLYYIPPQQKDESRCISILPLCPISLHNLSIPISFQQIDPDTPQRVNAPLGVARIAKITREETAEVCGKRAVHD